MEIHDSELYAFDPQVSYYSERLTHVIFKVRYIEY